MTALRTSGQLDFSSLKKGLQIKDGQLGAHLKKLEDVGYIFVQKDFFDRKPRTRYEISKAGSTALEEYVRTMENVLQKLKNT